jgi:hypothetical protein
VAVSAGAPGYAWNMTERDVDSSTGFVPRTGAEQPWEPEDLVEAQGQDPTPDNVARARAELEREGPAAIEKTVP